MDKAYEDFDGDDIADVKKSDNVIKFELLPGHPILLLTASAYCHARMVSPFVGGVQGRAVLYM